MYTVDIESNPAPESPQFTVRSGGYEFFIDTKGKGITPPDALLASLGSCIGVYMRKYAHGAGLSLDTFGIRVEGEFCRDTPVRFKTINVSIDLKGNAFDERRKEALLKFVKNCPVHNTLKNNPKVEVKIK
jgi:uncharacterized OsmC-like protein